MIKSKTRKANIKIYIIPFVIITLISLILVFTIRSGIRSYFYDLKKEEALKIARSVFIDLSHTAESYETINKLLEDKLINSLKVARMYEDEYNDEYLIELINAFEIDEIYTYNSEGIIEHSGSGKYIGWKAHEGHPVYKFMDKDEDIFIEEIRRDTESEMYYKYGYIKRSDGSFIQVGILAEKVHDLLEPVRLQSNLEEMSLDDGLVHLFAYNTDYLITASTNKDTIGLQIKDEVIISDINNGKIHDRINNNNGADFYEIFVPLEKEVNKIIGFGMEYSLDDMFPVIKKITLSTMFGLLIVYISLLYSIYTTYKRDEKLVRLAYYDNLTGLPNTEFLMEKFEENSISNKDNKDNKAVLLIKCDNLNLINLTFGYDYGNMVLKELGRRIKTLENRNIQLFKFTAEKFVLYINHYHDKEDLLGIINKVNDLFNQRFTINGISEHVAIKIGVVEYNSTDKSLDQLLKDATIALKYVDINVASNYRFFNESMAANVQREEIIERELREAISDEDTSKIYLFYQPIIDSKTDKIEGFEALARMNSEEFGLVSPVEFIDIAERKQLIIPFSKFILRVACRFAAELLKLGFNDIRVAVNISTIHFIRDDFVSTVLNIIEETGINGRNLELELTETIMMDNFRIVKERLKELRANEIQISLDDFGTGYSSLDRLSELSVDSLKIDKCFIEDITDPNKNSLIPNGIISMAHGLGIKTVAEGVELQAQKDYLLEHGCDKLQGYFISKPVCEEEAIMLIRENKN